MPKKIIKTTNKKNVKPVARKTKTVRADVRDEQMHEQKDTLIQKSTIKEKELNIDLDKKPNTPTKKKIFINLKYLFLNFKNKKMFSNER